jgi:hypothetical protein
VALDNDGLDETPTPSAVPVFRAARALFRRPDGDLHAVAGTDFAHQAGDVELHGAEADVKLCRDLGVGPALCDGHRDFFLALGQGDDRDGVGSGCPSGPPPEVVTTGCAGTGVEVRPAAAGQTAIRLENDAAEAHAA